MDVEHLPERRLAEKTRRIGCEWATIDHPETRRIGDAS
jgi:hypothetical protein